MFSGGFNEVRIIRNRAEAAAINNDVEKISCWLLNVGTHRKPYNDEEYALYRESLENVLEEIFNDEIVKESLFYPITPIGTVRRGRRNQFQIFEEMQYRTPELLRITNSKAQVVVERGSITGRIDAHIIIRVAHRGSLIRIDHKSFADLLQEELMTENERMAADPITYRSRDPSKPGETMFWPLVGRPYTSFRGIAHFDEGPTLAYMTKQWLTTDQERDILFTNIDSVRDQAQNEEYLRRMRRADQ